MRAAFWVGCAALLLSACSSEPVQQATAAHVSPWDESGDVQRRRSELRYDWRFAFSGPAA